MEVGASAPTINQRCDQKNRSSSGRRCKTKKQTERNPTSSPLAPALRPARFANPEILYLATGFYSSGQPPRLLTAARPCFRRCLRIAIFRKDSRVFASGLTISIVGLWTIPALDAARTTIENCQTLFKFTLFRRDPYGQYLTDLFVE